jgi:hypothetical protein
MDPVEAEMLWCLLSPHDWRPFQPLSTSAAKASIMWANGAPQTGLIHGTTELALISMSILAQRSQSPFFFLGQKGHVLLCLGDATQHKCFFSIEIPSKCPDLKDV